MIIIISVCALHNNMLEQYHKKKAIFRFLHANDLQMDQCPDDDFLCHCTSQFIMVTGTYTVQCNDEITQKSELFSDVFFFFCWFLFDPVTPKQNSLNASLTTYCSPACSEAQCNQSNPKKWRVSLGRCSRPLIWSDSHILDKHTCHCSSHITFSVS